MESCEDDTEVESSDGSTSPSSGSDAELEKKPPDSSASTLTNLENCDTNDDLIPSSSNDTEKREVSTDAGILKSGEILLVPNTYKWLFYLALLVDQ